MIEWTDRGGQEPKHVRCKVWQQCGLDVYCAPCPYCQPRLTLDADPRDMGIHLCDEGHGECQRCKGYVKITLDGPEPGKVN